MSPRTVIEIQPGALGRTRFEAEKALAEAGVEPEAADAMIRSTGRQRHIFRIQRHYEHALDQALADEGLTGLDPDEAPPSILALGVGLLVLDAFGPVPRPGEARPRVRHRAFRDCGEHGGGGGGAVQASTYGAVILLSRRFGVATPQIVLAADDGAIRTKVSGGGHSAEGLLRINSDERHDCQPAGWMLRATQEGLDRSLGFPSRVGLRLAAERTLRDREIGRSPLDLVVGIEGGGDAWGALWKRANAQQRLETTLDRWARVISELPPDEAQAAPPCVGADSRRPSMQRALAWIEELELADEERQSLAADLVLGELAPSVLEERLRSALRPRLGRTG